MTQDATYSYVYDADGNLTERRLLAGNVLDQRFTWDHRQRLAKVEIFAAGALSQTIDYRYDAAGGLVQRKATPAGGAATSEHYVLEEGRRLVTLDSDADVLRRYEYGPQGQLLFDQVFDGTGNPSSQSEVDLLLPIGDHQNSTRLVLGHDSADAVYIRQSIDYAPFGAVTAVRDSAGALTTAAIDTAFAHHGSALDASTKLQLKGARWYSPDLGRFVSVDSAEDGANWYAAFGNDPVNMSDPAGFSQQGHPLAGGFGGGVTTGSLIPTGMSAPTGMSYTQTPSYFSQPGGYSPAVNVSIAAAPSYAASSHVASASSGIGSPLYTLGTMVYYGYQAATPHLANAWNAVSAGWQSYSNSGTYGAWQLNNAVQFASNSFSRAWREASELVQFVSEVNANRTAANAIHRQEGRYGLIEPLYGLDQGQLALLPLSPSDARAKGQMISQYEAAQREASARAFQEMLSTANRGARISADTRTSSQFIHDQQRAFQSQATKSMLRIIGGSGDWDDLAIVQQFEATRERNALDLWRDIEAILPVVGARPHARLTTGPKGFSNPGMGNQQHAKFRSMLVEQTRTRPQDWLMRTAPSETGVDATYIGPKATRPGFMHAELKPFTLPGVNSFFKQLDKWQSNGQVQPGQTQLWFYNEGGIIGSSGINY